MTELQQIEFNMLKCFIEICDKLNLKYFLVCGSALGAVKYNGFIPWDDDLDVALSRDEYEIFCKEAPGMLPDCLFLQNYNSEHYFTHCFSKLRNSGTTYIEKSVSNTSINHGVYIDIFPLDGYPSEKFSSSILEIRKKIFLLLMSANYSIKHSSKGDIVSLLGRLFGFCKNPNIKLKRYTRMISRYSANDSELYCNHGNWQGKLEYAPREQYSNGTWATFEGLKVRIPENYDAYLTQKYGDWRADLPEDQRVGHHYYEVCDLTRPYTDYIEHLPNGKIRIKSSDELSPRDDA